MKKKKILLTLLAVVIAVPVLFLILAGMKFREEIAIVRSIKKIDSDIPAYYMEFKNGYHLDEVISHEITTDADIGTVVAPIISHGLYKKTDVKVEGAGCSTMAAHDKDGNVLWGRNFDWYDTVPLIIKSTPKDGYASISSCNFTNVTNDVTVVPEGTENAMKAIGAYYVPMDGINEKGLCVSILEVNEGGQKIVETGKPNLTVTVAVRLLLERAANVEEALALLDQYDICPTGGISSHLSMCDSSGRSVAVEFMDGENRVVETPVVTNFNLTSSDISVGGESPMVRYQTLMEALDKTDGTMTREEVVEAMDSVSKTEGKWTTRWTMVYSSEECRVDYYWNANYDHVAESCDVAR
ncbi:MAG: linear amide C-N hydrolase [Oscillospiraceae bacterium]|nr:linear amide C-N hydrolase [Oscillospiraceae bacterium]